MKKIAIFVEGETEYDFIKRLLHEVIGEQNISIVANKMFGGNRNSEILRVSSPHFESIYDNANFQASIFISGNSTDVLYNFNCTFCVSGNFK